MSIRNYPSAFMHPFSHIPTLEQSGPVIVDRGEGIYIYDDKGKKYLEGNSGLWNVVLGFDNEKLIEAAQEGLCEASRLSRLLRPRGAVGARPLRTHHQPCPDEGEPGSVREFGIRSE